MRVGELRSPEGATVETGTTDLARSALTVVTAAGLVHRGSFLGGRWHEGAGDSELRDPASGTSLGTILSAGSSEVDAALEWARRAQSVWSRTLPRERANILRRWAALINARSQMLAKLLVLENGKPLDEALGELAYAASYFDWYAGEAERLNGAILASHLPLSDLQVRYAPVGIALAITPWNFPAAMMTRKAGAALAAGCPVIVKPALETPLIALAIAALGAEAGLPDGALSVLLAEPDVIAPLLREPAIRAVSFTGSTSSGRRVAEVCASTIKRVSLELGGHAPFVVCADASLDRAVEGAVRAKYATSGQDCLAVNRILVHRSLAGQFTSRFARASDALSIGHGLDPKTQIGPMTKLSVVETCRAHVEDAIRGGATRATRRPPGGEGHFVTPTVLSDVPCEARIMREESFGPVVPIVTFDDDEEALAEANATEWGLAAYVYSGSARRLRHYTERLEFGMVGANTFKFTGPNIPFGGWKQSGLGREGGQLGIHEFTEQRYVCTGGLEE
jgi:aspartate-semialdehyde dehydrogenase